MEEPNTIKASRPLAVCGVTVALVVLVMASCHILQRSRQAHETAGSLALTGTPDSRFADFDDAMFAFLRSDEIPGGALAIARQGRLVYARGYEWADKELKTPVDPTSLFRIASVSKPFTAVGIFTLVQSGRLDLDAKAFRLLGLKPCLAPHAKVDPRLWKITVRDLLQHSGGFGSVEPMVDNDDLSCEDIAAAAGVPSPPDQRAIIRYMMGRPLAFEPGTHYEYSNFGYCVLGRVIEKVSGQPYDAYIKDQVLKPIGITRMRLGKTRLRDRAPDEVRYYAIHDSPVPSVFPEDKENKVPWPYGGWNLEAMDSHGGWIGSAVDLVRFASSIDFPQGKPLLTENSKRMMEARREPSLNWDDGSEPAGYFYACGWEARQQGNAGPVDYSHSGYLDGMWAWIARRHDGTSIAVLFNGSPNAAGPLIDALNAAANGISEWPDRDLFPQYLSGVH